MEEKPGRKEQRRHDNEKEGFGKYIEKIDGDYFSIVGFPVHKLYELLKKYDVIK